MNQKATIDFSTILASSVHDMKNSLGMLLNSLETLVEEIPPANASQAQQFKTLQYEASRINGELIQLLTLYRMQNQFLPMNIDEHYLNDLIEDQLARNQGWIDASDISVQVSCDDSLHWYFDVDLIGGVLHNVLVNSLRYTKSALLIEARQEGDFLLLAVSDDGPGYPDPLLAQPSDMKDKASVSEGSSHLGFYFAEQIASSHKRGDVCGYIELDNRSSLGGGRFLMYLP